MSAVERGAETRALEVFIGNWINEGHLILEGAASGRIVTSDVYEWVQGGFFVVHRAYGRLADTDVGGVEIMGWDTAEQTHRSWFFDSQGNAAANQLLHLEPDVWRWQGTATRSTSTFSEAGRIQTTLHERLEGGAWITSMEVVLTRVD